MKVKIINKSQFPLPEYETSQAVGLDVRANITEDISIRPLERVLVPTGIYVELPPDYEIQVRPRSGLAIKKGITVLNSPGTIDPDYRGEIKIIIINLSNQDFILTPGERIAQFVVSKFEKIEWESVEEIADSERGSGGFGSTGLK